MPGRPNGAVGSFLRLITINDSYTLDHYPHVASAVIEAKAQATKLGMVVTSHMNGDFLSPSPYTAMDGGATLIEGLNQARIDYCCLGNHEFDVGFTRLATCCASYKGTIINSNASVSEFEPLGLPRFLVLDVGDKKVVHSGCVTTDRNLFAPSAIPDATTVTAGCLEAWAAAKAELGRPADAFIPMTHQTIEEDRDTAAALQANPELAARTPVILAGHEHDVIIEDVGKTLIIKVGHDAENIGIVDVWWTASGTIERSYKLLPAINFPPEPTAAAFVAKKAAFLKAMMETPILTLPEACSSSRSVVRYEPSGLATFLLGKVKRALKKDGVELVMTSGASIRGNASYKPGHFTLGQLYNEFGFETEQAIIQLPGKIIADAIYYSRTSSTGEKPAYLHADDGCELDANHKVLSIDGAAFDPERLYTVSIYQLLLMGMGEIKPLMKYVKDKPVRVPDKEMCLGAKELVITTVVKDAWASLLELDTWDKDGAGLEAGVRAKFAELDRNGDGKISAKELEQFLERWHTEHALDASDVSAKLLTHLMKIVDLDGDGAISMGELLGLARGACHEPHH